jgi:hypothetical protein
MSVRRGAGLPSSLPFVSSSSPAPGSGYAPGSGDFCVGAPPPALLTLRIRAARRGGGCWLLIGQGWGGLRGIVRASAALRNCSHASRRVRNRHAARGIWGLSRSGSLSARRRIPDLLRSVRRFRGRCSRLLGSCFGPPNAPSPSTLRRRGWTGVAWATPRPRPRTGRRTGRGRQSRRSARSRRCDRARYCWPRAARRARLRRRRHRSTACCPDG